MPDKQIGVLSCSGEEYLGGTLARMATRRVMEHYRPDTTVTLCLPLYIAGGEEERNFAEVYPVIAVEGCDKCCSTKATERFSGPVQAKVVISEILGDDEALSKRVSARDLTEEHDQMADRIAQEICKAIDAV